MDINGEIKEIIDRYSEGKIDDKTAIVYDGIVDYQEFSGVVFLLKEATAKGKEKFGEGWSLAEEAAREAKEAKEAKEKYGGEPRGWKSVCYWMEAMKNPGSSFLDAEKCGCGGNLSQIAFVNIKKTAGKGTSNNAELEKVSTDAEFSQIVREEISAIKRCGKPLLVICGGTFEYAMKIYHVAYPKEGDKKDKNYDEEKFARQLECGAYYFVKDDVVFIDFPHPSVRCGVPITYAYAQSVFSEIKAKSLW